MSDGHDEKRGFLVFDSFYSIKVIELLKVILRSIIKDLVDFHSLLLSIEAVN